MTFNDGLRVMRAARNMSQLELAKKSGVRNWNISRAEVGRWNLTEDEQYWIRVALNWPPSVDAVLDVIEQATFGPEAKE